MAVAQVVDESDWIFLALSHSTACSVLTVLKQPMQAQEVAAQEVACGWSAVPYSALTARPRFLLLPATEVPVVCLLMLCEIGHTMAVQLDAEAVVQVGEYL